MYWRMPYEVAEPSIDLESMPKAGAKKARSKATSTSQTKPAPSQNNYHTVSGVEKSTTSAAAAAAGPVDDHSAIQAAFHHNEGQHNNDDRKPAAVYRKSVPASTVTTPAAEEIIMEELPPMARTPLPVHRTLAPTQQGITSPIRIFRARAKKSVLEEKGISPSAMMRVKGITPQQYMNQKNASAKQKPSKKRKSEGGEGNKTPPQSVQAKLVWQGEPTEKVEDIDWKGWTKEVFQRMGGKTKSRKDTYWYTPIEKKKLRSLTEIRRFLAALEESGGDELKAWNKFKGKTG